MAGLSPQNLLARSHQEKSVLIGILRHWAWPSPRLHMLAEPFFRVSDGAWAVVLPFVFGFGIFATEELRDLTLH